MSNWSKHVFLHIPKTAGTTLTSIIARNYSDSEIVRLYEPAHFEEQMIEGLKSDSAKMLFGHFPYVNHLNDSYIYVFTFLRDPILRTISTYIHLKNSPDSLHKKWMKDVKEFPDFLKMPQAFNWQVRHLSGQKYKDDFGRDLNASLAMAEENLERMNVVGITERFNDSLFCISADLRWNKLWHQNQNVRSNNNEAQLIYEKYYEEIIAENTFDFKLYELGNRLLDHRLSQTSTLEKLQFSARKLF